MMDDYILSYIGCTKAVEMWFHAAHHVTKYQSFSGDHVHIYGEIYEALSEDFDNFVEKSIGLFDNESFADPFYISGLANKVLSDLQSPVDCSSDEIARVGLDVMMMHLSMLENVYNHLEAQDELTLGFDDMLAAAANTYEKYIYMLRQRNKRLS